MKKYTTFQVDKPLAMIIREVAEKERKTVKVIVEDLLRLALKVKKINVS